MTLLASGMSIAHAADDPFAAATEKTKEIGEALSGDLALYLCAIAIIIAGLGAIFGKIEKKTAAQIAGGAILVGSAFSIAEWVFAS